MLKPKLFVSVSGGKTSAYMAKHLKDNFSTSYELLFVFANTGQEREETLEFLRDMDSHWNLGIIWVEAVVHHGIRKSSTHRIVTFETASRNGEPYEEAIKKYGIPNSSFPWCTRELKLNPMKSFRKKVGWDKCDTAVGIRIDEERRRSANAASQQIIYPLMDWFETDKIDVNDWFEEQPFNLNLQEHQGNCSWCWKKSFKKHALLIEDSPEIYNFPRRMEKVYPKHGANPYDKERVFFRMNTNTDTLFRMQQAGFTHPAQLIDRNPDTPSGCSESCEAYG